MAPVRCGAASLLVLLHLCGPLAAQAREAFPAQAAAVFPEHAAAVPAVPNPMHMGCEVLHQAEMAGQFVDEQEQQWYDYAKKLCHSNGWAPGKSQTSPAEVLDVLQQKAAEYSQGDGNAVAKGCKDILKAKDDGKLEWFEKQPWYKGAMKICLAAVENKDGLPMDPAALGDMKVALPEGSAPAMVMKKVCDHLDQAKNRGALMAVQQMPWYSKAMQACSSIEIASPEQIASMVKEQAEQPESPSGQLLRQTCDKFRDGRHAGIMNNMEKEDWFAATNKLCSAMGGEQIPDRGFEGDDIVKKCMWLDKMKEKGDGVFNAAWTERLDKMCSWLKRRHAGGGKGRGKPFLRQREGEGPPPGARDVHMVV